MVVATPSPVNDAALNAQLDITRDASIANLRTEIRGNTAAVHETKRPRSKIRNSDPRKWYRAASMLHWTTPHCDLRQNTIRRLRTSKQCKTSRCVPARRIPGKPNYLLSYIGKS